jgi:outer membrane protein TolC
MSQKTVTFTQKLPYFGKRDSKKDVFEAQEGVLAENLEQAKVNIVNEIKNQAYNAWEYEKLYDIISEYEDLTKQNIELFESYTSTSDNQHMGIMSAELTLSDLKIQKSALNAKIKTAYAKLSYLAATKIEALHVEVLVDDMKVQDKLSLNTKNNHYLKIKDKQIEQNQANAKSAELNNYPDVNLIAGYSRRENFDNYYTFGLGLTLPIYGTEDAKEESSRALVLATKSAKKDVELKLESEFKEAYLKMKSANEIYHIINDEALPQLEHMFELTSSSISTGGDLFKYIDILVQKLKLEQKSISAMASFKKAQAKISALNGEIK